MNEKELRAWYDDVNAQLEAHERWFPACWGGQFCLGNFMYVSDEDMMAVLKTERELHLWYCVAYSVETSAPISMRDVIKHQDDDEWLSSNASELVDDGSFFYTELFPSDLDVYELTDLADDRPDLFPADDLYDRSLVQPAMTAGLLDRIGGERAWVGGPDDGWFAFPRRESELRRYFDTAADLEDQRVAGTTFEDWIRENELRGLLTATDSMPLRHLTQIGLERAWATLSDVPVDDRDCIETRWRAYPAGTPREEIWYDFDVAYERGVAALMFSTASVPEAPSAIAAAATRAASSSVPEATCVQDGALIKDNRR